jgi:hypothetical protein
MNKVLFTLALLGILLGMSCDGNNGDDFDPATASLIGTWEASGELVVEGDQRTYKSTLVFVNETEYRQETRYKSIQGAFDLTVENMGTYIREEERIVYTDSYRTSPNAPFAGNNVYQKPYNFMNKNTLEHYGPGVDNTYIKNMTYKRK